MGSTYFLSLSPNSLYHLFLNPTLTLRNPNLSSKFRCSSSYRRNRGSNFDAFDSRPFEFEDEFGSRKRRREKRRNWWSDYDNDDEDDDDDNDEFGFWGESSSAIDWISKIFIAFGWMVPAIAISTLLGTGSNSLIMAIVLPLGQTALSLVMEKLIGGPSSSPSSRPRSRRRSKSRSRSRSRPKRNPSYPRGPNPTNGDYQSWAAANNPSAKQSGNSSSNYGGWDELDQHEASSNSFTTEQREEKVSSLQREYMETGKLSSKIYSDKPLFLRLLFAAFPLLDSWTRFFF